MVTLKQTDTELLLHVSDSQGDRARAIEGGRWDPERQCCVFKRTRRALRAILSEFGDELDLASSDLAGLPIEIWLQGESGRESVPPLMPGTATDAVRRELEQRCEELSAQVRRKDGELARASSRIDELEAELAAQAERHHASDREANDRAQKDLHRAQQRIRELEEAISALKTKGRQVDGLQGGVHVVLRALFPADANLDNLAKSVLMNEDLPVLMAMKLESELRSRLAVKYRAEFVDLIKKAEGAGILGQESIDLAHMIRKQRNRLVHSYDSGSSSESIRIARNLLVLSAMRIILKELAKD